MEGLQVLFLKRRGEVRGLSQFQRERELSVPTPARSGKQIIRDMMEFGLSVGSSEDLKRLGRLSEAGRRLEQLAESEVWKDLEAIRFYQQEIADHTAKSVGTDDRRRFQAAVEWSAVESFFKEIRLRIHRGKEAQRILSERNRSNVHA